MSEAPWLSAPIGIDANRWVTRSGLRKVLVAINSLVAGHRLDDVIGLIETDLHVQVAYTKAPGVFGAGVESLIRSFGGLEMPWQQATHERFDLAVSAGYEGMDRIHAPIMVLPHGAGYGKRAPACPDARRAGRRAVYGLDPQRLMRDGRLIPARIVLSHRAQRALLASQCPPAAKIAMVAGDPCLDRLAVSLPARADYRAALGIEPDQRLVLIASTWGPHSVIGRNIELVFDVMRELRSRRYRVGTLVHPAAWAAHGVRQLRAWLTDARDAGLMMVDPERDWRPSLLAADYVIGDHGSTTVYAAALGIPVLHNGFPAAEVDPRSPHAWLARHAPTLTRGRPLVQQLRTAASAATRTWQEAVLSRLTSRPGHAHRLLRQEMYRLLGLAVPGRHRRAEPVPVPDAGGA
ncbi:MAG TPA: hypothetical protein VHW44_24190 [Pseudonocardiaceae bacterium]|nr:hypothetical protein [Pseudonocardiaceae bacterium]